MTDDQTNLPMKDEIRNIGEEAQQDAGFQKMLKFKKGTYICDGEEVPLGTRMLAHTLSWTKAWIHFVDQKVVERKNYRIARGERAPERERLPDNDQSKWPIGINKLPADPWVYQYLLPMENPETGDVAIFVASSFGGRRAIADLCTAWSRRAAQIQKLGKVGGQPFVTLQTVLMPTKNFGDVPRPHFEIVSWDDPDELAEILDGSPVLAKPRIEVSEEVLKKQEFDDEIPF